ncbi:winged helix-turn-helix domain-containing protein [Halopseudomonas nanhaiensis]|uniref:winged helix-turn-helix domain-containing protein n=1 Tax=Halopseudomonas nanhaiensis TaxID=2830842 RepID=UPI001CBFB860|nr:winged helix-turn-helix domain-containing protein [Halopseudomonas nanhaiensis]UAW97402.1 winged helix-turn-helix domain-containing protein [Halopseudomonas nanhaiensis]
MPASLPSPRRVPPRYHFGCAEFCPETLQLSVLGETVTLERRPLRLLHVLLQNADRVVPHEELLQVVWDGRITVRNVLPNAMTKLRKALGRDAKLIVTIAGVGYRLNGPVRFDGVGSAEGAVVDRATRMAPDSSLTTLDVLPLRIRAASTDEPADATSRPASEALSRSLIDVPLPKRLEAFRQFAASVAKRHEEGLGYTGISGVNVNFFADGRLLLLARRPRDTAPPAPAYAINPYRAPELYRGYPGDARSDIYSLGVILYQLCSADIHRPLLGDWRIDVPDPRSQALIEAATCPDPSKRAASVAEWLDAAPAEGPSTGWHRLLGLPIRRPRRSRV